MDAEISLKTSVDVARIRRACRVAERCLRYLAPCVRPGISTAELDSLAGRFLEESGAVPALRGYKGFPGCICTSVNNVAAHGIPIQPGAGGGGHPLHRHHRQRGRVARRRRLDIHRGGGQPGRPAARCGPPGARAWRASAPRLPATGSATSGRPSRRARGGSAARSSRTMSATGSAGRCTRIPWCSTSAPRTRGCASCPGMVFTVEPMLNLGGRDVHVPATAGRW